MAYTIVTASRFYDISNRNFERITGGLEAQELRWHLFAGRYLAVWIEPVPEEELKRRVEAAIAVIEMKPAPKPKRPLKRITVSKRPASHLIRDKAKRDAKIQELVTAGKIKRVVSDRSPEEWAAMLEDARENPYRSTIR